MLEVNLSRRQGISCLYQGQVDRIHSEARKTRLGYFIAFRKEAPFMSQTDEMFKHDDRAIQGAKLSNPTFRTNIVMLRMAIDSLQEADCKTCLRIRTSMTDDLREGDVPPHLPAHGQDLRSRSQAGTCCSGDSKKCQIYFPSHWL